MVRLGIENLWPLPVPNAESNFPRFDWLQPSITQLLAGPCLHGFARIVVRGKSFLVLPKVRLLALCPLVCCVLAKMRAVELVRPGQSSQQPFLHVNIG